MTNDYNDMNSPGSGPTHNLPEPVRIIHKEQESISAFCLNQVSISRAECSTRYSTKGLIFTILYEYR